MTAQPAPTEPPQDPPHSQYTFTVFTPTRNRADLLPRVYASLNDQIYRDFEWLVIDNDSTDATPLMMAAWQEQGNFPIRYLRQVDRGVHVSFNRAVHEAAGYLFVGMDSDDWCHPNALERLNFHWNNIPTADRSTYAGVTALCMDQTGRLVGSAFPTHVIDSTPLEITFRHHVRGEKWGCLRTDVMRQHLHPEAEGYSGSMPSSLVWNAIGRTYRTRYVNEVLHVFTSDLPSTLSRPRDPSINALGSVLQHRSLLDEDLRLIRWAPLEYLRSATLYSRFAHHLGLSATEQVHDLTRWPARLAIGLMWSLGRLLAFRDDVRSQASGARTERHYLTGLLASWVGRRPWWR